MGVEVYASGSVVVEFKSREESLGVTKIINMLRDGKIVKVNKRILSAEEERDAYHWSKFGLYSAMSLKNALYESPSLTATGIGSTMKITPDDLPGGVGNDFVEWLEYYINKLVVPNGGVANGDIFWETSEGGMGTISVVDNKIVHKIGETVYVPEAGHAQQARTAQGTHKAKISITRLKEILPTMNGGTIYAEAGSTQHGRVDWVDVWVDRGYMRYRVLTMDMDDRYADDALLMVTDILGGDPRVRTTGLDLSQIHSQAQPSRLMSDIKIGE